MEQDNLNLLKNIKRLEVSDALYDRISQQIERDIANKLPFYKVGIAASILFAMIISQVFFITNAGKMNTTQLNQTSELVEINNNTLYYE